VKRIAIIGGGPAGLRAAEVAAEAGAEVTLFDAKPSVGRKFLVAGKGGMNLTHSEPLRTFASRYSASKPSGELWSSILAEFTPADLREWATRLGAETFEAGSRRVYLKNLKAATLLRAWVAKLRSLGVRFEMRHRLVSVIIGSTNLISFSNGCSAETDAVILALGGASWPQTGSDGRWTGTLENLGISIQPLVAANCGWEHEWNPDFLTLAEGKPLKNVTVRAGEKQFQGELMITRYGIEGGPVYALGKTLREMPAPCIAIDFKPAHSHEQLMAKMESVRRNFIAEARQRWKLTDAAYALLARNEWNDVHSLAHEAKNCVLPLKGPRPVAESISSAGGVCWSEMDSHLMVKKLPGLFVAGEMIDWEAPTGGYLLQGCFATGSLAARSAVAWLKPPAAPQ
jgi:uncharacterized flavoprotein (TIGR03862 family)